MSSPTYNSPIPTHWTLFQNDIMSTYMVGLFRHKLGFEAELPPTPRFPLKVICEADRVVDILVAACRNRIKARNVDIIRLGERSRGHVQSHPLTPEEAEKLGEAGISSLKPLVEVLSPAIITDRGGFIMVWYLPGGVSKPNQNQLFKQTSLLEQPLRSSVTHKATANWRTAEPFFRKGAEASGAINLSPAWYQQGRDVHKHMPEVSSLLKEAKLGNGARQWVRSMRYTGAILGGALAIMHPEMYVKAREAMVNLGKWALANANREMLELLGIWPNVYSVASVMVNRASPIHLDSHGRAQWLDMLLTFGDYEDLDFVLPTLGMRLRYNPGTIVALSGQLLEHGAGEVRGNRGIVSFYMRDNVHERMNIQRPHHVHYSQVGKVGI